MGCSSPTFEPLLRPGHRTRFRQGGERTRARSIGVASTICCSSKSGPLPLASHAARSMFTRMFSAPSGLTCRPFTRRGDQVLYQHHLGRATGLVDLAEAGLFEPADRYLAQANAPLRQAGRPVDQNSEESRRLLLLEQQAVPLAGEAVDLTFRTSGTSGAKAHSALATRCSRLPSVVRTWVCNGTARWRTWAAYEWA